MGIGQDGKVMYDILLSIRQVLSPEEHLLWLAELTYVNEFLPISEY